MSDRSTWFVQRRLGFIDWCLAKRGTIRRADLMRVYDVSIEQASKDINEFIRRWPGAMTYDRSAKRYVAVKPYEPRLASDRPLASAAVRLAGRL